MSVVVPSLNRRHHLQSTLESILGQDYPNLECIVIDGGSTDGSVELLRTYGDRIVWRSRPDKGAFDAINDGFDVSKGEILAWLNADDEWVVPGTVSAVVEFMRSRSDTDVVYGSCGAIDESGYMFDLFPAREWDLPQALVYCDHIINQAASFMRRRIFEEVGGLYPAWCHDHDLWLRIGLAGGRFEPMALHMANARIWDNNLGNSKRVVIPAKIGLTKRFFAQPLPPHLKRLKRRAMSNAYLRGIYYLKVKRLSDWPEAIKLSAQAVAASPANLPYIAHEVLGGLANHTPLRHLVYGVRRLTRNIGGLIGGVSRATSRALRAILPLGVLVVAFGGAAASAYYTSESLAASIFYFTTPALLFLIWRDLRR